MAPPIDTVAATKVTPPRPPSRYLGRSRLLDQLDESVDAGRGVVLVSAPAGAGKTTLVAGWLDRRDGETAWLQIDEGDDDPSRFWTYVAAALQHSVPGIDETVRTVLGDGLDAVIERVVNDVASVDDEVVLVLDDYHLISNTDVHRSVERLLSLRPANWNGCRAR